LQVLSVKRLTIDITGLMMLAEAEPKPRRRRNESACGAPVGPVDLILRIDECPGVDLVSSRNEMSGEQDRSAGLCGVLTQVFLSFVARY
jgi:hypothetical protein